MIKVKIVCLFFGLLGVVDLAYSQNYVTNQAGNWNNPLIWTPNGIPNSGAGTITVNHAVTIPAGLSVTLDETTINAQLTLAASATAQLIVNDGTGIDLTVNGTWVRGNLSNLTQNAGSSISFEAGSTYQHNYTTTEGTIPVASWDTGSTLLISGYTTFTAATVAGNWSQNFGNVTYDCANQTAILSLGGLLTSIAGNFTISNTRATTLRLSTIETSALSIGGSLTLSGTSKLTLTTTGDCTTNLSGNFNQSGGTTLTTASGNGGRGTLNLKGDFSLTSGTITETATGSRGNFNFIGSTPQQFVNTGSIFNDENWFIAAGSTVNLGTYAMKSSTASTFILNGTIICGSTAAGGAIQNNVTAGNIQTATSGGRTYASGSTIIYQSASPQFIGTGHPSATGVTTIIDNPSGVSLASAVTIGGVLSLNQGIVSIGSQTLTLNGTLTVNLGSLSGTSTSTLIVGGNTGGSLGTLVFDPANSVLGTLTLNRTGIGGAVTLNSILVVSTTLNLNNGDFNNISGLTMGNASTLTRYASSQLLGNRPLHTGTNSYNVTYRTFSTSVGIKFSTGLELPISADVDGLNSMTVFTGIASDSVDLIQSIYLNGDLTLTRGRLLGNSNIITLEGNWLDNSGNFSPGTSTEVFNGVSSVGGTSSSSFGNVRLNTGKSLTFLRDASVAGDFDIQPGSTFSAIGITFTLNGTVTQTVSANGSSFHNITVTKSGGNIQLTSDLSLVGLLRFNAPSANCDFQSSGFLTLLSTSDAAGSAASPGTAQIFRLSGGNTVSGDVTVQRYISGEGRIYRYLSSPVTNATVASWQDDFMITGQFTGNNVGGNVTVCGLLVKPSVSSMFYYNESTVGTIDKGYLAFPLNVLGTNATSSLSVGLGYAAFIRECTDPTIVDVTGPINQGNITFPNVTFTNTGDASADGYNLVGNPYPCTIDWDNGGWTRTRISNIVSIKDNGTGIMQYWDGATGGVINGQIAPGQGFWVRATAANPVLRVTENVKGITPNQSADFYRQAAISTLTLSLSDGHITDQAFVKIRSNSKNSLDDWDAPKLNNDEFDLYTLSEDHLPMAINAVNTINCSSPVLLGIKDLKAGTYTVNLSSSGDLEQYSYVLHDGLTNQDIPFTSSYSFTVDSNPLSSKVDRFSIQLSPKITSAPVDLSYDGILCEAQSTKVKLNATVPIAIYQFTNEGGKLINTAIGSGPSLTFDVPADSLKTGMNTFTVKSLSVCGSVYDAKTINIFVDKASTRFLLAAGFHCQAGSVLLRADSVPEGFEVNWYADNVTSSNILFRGSVFETPVLLKSSTYFASLKSPHGCSGDRVPIKAEIVNYDAPTITSEGLNILRTNYSENIQWFLEGTPIVGANMATLTAEKSGLYSVKVRINNTCEAQADFEFMVTGIENPEGVLVYPNPVGDELQLRIPGDKITEASFISSIGSKMKLKPRIGSDSVFDTSGVSSGFYVVEIRTIKHIYNYKVIKN